MFSAHKIGLSLLVVFLYLTIGSTIAVEEPSKWLTTRTTTPGVQLELNEEVRTQAKGELVEVTYSLIASGFAQGKTYSLWMYRIGEEPARVIDKLYVDESGEMLVEEVKPHLDKSFFPIPLAKKVPITADNHQKGEPFQLGLISTDQTVQGHAKVFPVPIEDRQEDCHLYLELIDPNRTAFAAWGRGFASNEELEFESRSNGEVIRSKRNAEADGNFVHILLPEVKRKSVGNASFRVTSSSCSLIVEYDWGRRK